MIAPGARLGRNRGGGAAPTREAGARRLAGLVGAPPSGRWGARLGRNRGGGAAPTREAGAREAGRSCGRPALGAMGGSAGVQSRRGRRSHKRGGCPGGWPVLWEARPRGDGGLGRGAIAAGAPLPQERRVPGRLAGLVGGPPSGRWGAWLGRNRGGGAAPTSEAGAREAGRSCGRPALGAMGGSAGAQSRRGRRSHKRGGCPGGWPALWEPRPRGDGGLGWGAIAAGAPLPQERRVPGRLAGLVGGPPSGRWGAWLGRNRGGGAAPTREAGARRLAGLVGGPPSGRWGSAGAQSRRGRRSHKRGGCPGGWPVLWEARPRGDGGLGWGAIAAGAPLPHGKDCARGSGYKES